MENYRENKSGMHIFSEYVYAVEEAESSGTVTGCYVGRCTFRILNGISTEVTKCFLTFMYSCIVSIIVNDDQQGATI